MICRWVFQTCGGERTPLRDSIPCRPKGSTLCTFLRYPILVTDPKIFLKAPLAPILTYFEGGRRKTAIFGQYFPKRAFFLPNFFKNVSKMFPKIWPKQGLFSALGELEKSIWSTQEKVRRPNFRNFFENLPHPPPRENPRSALNALF